MIAVMLFNQSAYLDFSVFKIEKANAQTLTLNQNDPYDNHNEHGLIVIMVESGLLDNLTLENLIKEYTQNAQDRVPHSKAFIMSVDKDERPFKIATVLEKFYFEGMDTDLIDDSYLNNNNLKEDGNKLAGIVLIGDIPLPVVMEEEKSFATIYPYTDFYRKKYIFNYETEKYEINDTAEAYNPEIWHGVIKPPSQNSREATNQLIEYFEKNKKYSKGDPDYADFSKRIFYANFPAMEEQANFMDYRNYERYVDYMEEIAFGRLNKHLLKNLIKEVSLDMGSEEPVIPDETIDGMFDVTTEYILKKYMVPFSESLKIFRGKINDKIKEIGRWEVANQSAEIDTPDNLISMRDEYAKYELRFNQLKLEKEIDDLIKEEISDTERAMEVITEGKLKIKLEVLDVDAGTRNFTFYSYVDGEKVLDIQSAKECGIYRGSPKTGNNVLENNSVLVKANRMYNPDTLLNPDEDDDDWKLEDQKSYIEHGGCTFNNSIAIKTDEIDLDPKYCIEEEAYKSLFDIVGSIEVSSMSYDPMECPIDIMSFHPGNDDKFNEIGAGATIAGVTIGQTMSEVIKEAYKKIDDKSGVDNVSSTKQKATEVIQYLIKTGDSIKYEPIAGSEITLTATSETKDIDSLIIHKEPTNETIASIKHLGEPRVDGNGNIDFPPIITPSTPADGIRYIQLAKNGAKEKYEYPNLYRIEGENPDDILENFLNMIEEKEAELSDLIGKETDVISRYIFNNSEIIEPIIWNSMGIDQKLASIIPKYTDRDSFMPTPEYNPPRYPQTKPNGYEVLHIVADGDYRGYNFGLNKAMKPVSDERIEDAESNDGNRGDDEEGDGDEEGDSGGDGNYICGDPKGVEIWEWFDAIQCWIEEEIIPASELFKLDSSCGASMPAAEEEEEELEYVDPFEDTANNLEQIDIVMERRSLVPGQTETISIYPINSDGDSIMGYIDPLVHIELSDSSIGEVNKNDFNIFTGFEDIQFTAKKTGSVKMTISMQGTDIEYKLDIDVYDSINIEWSDEEFEENGVAKFKIGVKLLNPNEGRISNVNTDIVISPENPTDGGFENSGKIQLIEGVGELVFVPTPGPTEVVIIDKEEFIDSTGYTIYPPPGPPVKVLMRAPEYIPVGENVQFKVVAVDAYGQISKGFNETIQIAIDEESEDYAEVLTPTINLRNGEGKVKIQAKKYTGEILLSASHEELEDDIRVLPVLARITDKDWNELYTQNLFASFVGFPAGNIFEENYFGGTHLFNGKTEAVFSFMSAPTPEPVLTVNPNYKINLTQPQQTVYIGALGNKLVMQAFDKSTLQTLLSKKFSLNFENVNEWNSETELKENNIYVELLDSNYRIKTSDNEIIIHDIFESTLLRVTPKIIDLPNPEYELLYNNEPEFDLIELILSDGFGQVARVMINFAPDYLDENSFDSADHGLVMEKVFHGSSTNDPNGIILYEFGGDIEEEERAEYYGFEGLNNYIELFSAGQTIGEAVKNNLPVNGILLGDPTIKLETKNSGGLDYDKTRGHKIYQDSKNATIISFNYFNFNNDPYEDLALVLSDGRVRLLEGGATEPKFIDRGDIAFLGDGAIAIEAFDFANDGYEDLLIGTKEGRLAILNNDREVITRTNQQIKVGKQLYQLIKGDMDDDGQPDLVTLDSRGDIRIFYNDNGAFPQNGKLIGNYGFSLKLNDNLYKDLDVRYPGIEPPMTNKFGIDLSALPQVDLPTPSVEPSESQNSGMQAFLDGDVSEPSESKSKALYEALSKMAEAGREDPVALATSGVDTSANMLPWPEENDTESKADDPTETYFEPIENVDFLDISKIENVDFLDISKTVHNKERPREANLDLEESLVYTIRIESDRSKQNFVVADTVPDSLTADPTTINCEGSGCENIIVLESGIRLFIGGINLNARSPITITYEAKVKHTPEANIFITTLDEPSYLSDRYMDIMVSPPYNTTNDWIQHYTTGPRTYAIRSTSEDVGTQKSDIEDLFETNTDFLDSLTTIMDQEYDEDNQLDPDSIVLPEGMDGALDEATGNNDCYDNPDNLTGCAGAALDKLAGLINDFACMGGGCFPIPWNFTFMVPQEMPFPIFAFPAGVGPFPLPGTMAMPGAAAIPGTFMSVIRFYMGFSLTGGMGIAFCWGPYMGSTTPPPPLIPIPYPPPIGNCMVTALPVQALPWGKACGVIEDAINQLMKWINKGINKANSAMASVNNQDLPVEFSAGSEGDGGAGGLEIGLAVNLGDSMKFEPPAKGFSNLHISAFDSLGGAISSWFDRQIQEILNKLLTLPTFYIYLPDIKSLWSLDFDATEKAGEMWIENMGKSDEVTSKTLDKLDEHEAKTGEDNFLEKMSAVEAQARIYNLNTLEGMYDVANSLPFINITEKPVNFKVPWLSAGEIQAYIIQLQNWVNYYKREYNRVKDKWEAISCQDLEDAEDNPETTDVDESKAQAIQNASNCAARKIAEAFTVNFDDVLESVQENIEVLQSYLAFPKQLIKYKQQLAGYIRGVACYIDVIANMLGGWYKTIFEQVVTWAEMIATIIEIIKNIKDLIDIFIDFDTNCSICTNERWANFGWWMLLAIIIPEIPIISFPKWPDIVFDISDLDFEINLEIPILRITPEPIPLPPLPYISLPDFPTFNLMLSLPPIPVLPRLPDLPDLPELPPIPTLDLPTLPSPPKLPDIGKPFEIIIPLIEQILNIWCLIKKSFAPVPEANLNTQMTLLTNRPAYLIPLDALKLSLPNVALFDLGFNEMRIDVIAYIGLRLKFLPQVLQSASDQWNEWIEAIPEAMNEAYEKYLDTMETKVQGAIDDFDAMVKGKIAELEDKAQSGLDSATEDMAEAFGEADAWLRDLEEKWQEQVDELEIDIDYQEYVNAIRDANEKIGKWGDDIRDKVDEFFDEYRDIIHGLNYMIPLAAHLEAIEKYDLDEELQEHVLDEVGDALNTAIGVTGGAGLVIIDQLIEYLKACAKNKDECLNEEDYFGSADTEKNKYTAFSGIQNTDAEIMAMQQVAPLITQLTEELKKLKNAELVDFHKVKEDLGVPDYEMAPRITSIDKIKWMENELVAYGEQLEKDAEDLKNVKDLYALAKVPPRTAFPNELASSEFEPSVVTEEARTFTSAVLPNTNLNEDKLLAQFNEQKESLLDSLIDKANAQDASISASGNSFCTGICLPDPITEMPTSFVPKINDTINSETLFLPSGHIVYTDGKDIYFKTNLSLETENKNISDDVGTRIFDLEKDILPNIGQTQYLMEAVNMLKTTLVENGSATFSWLESTNPNLYGYGIELERSVLGYDSDEQYNNLPDTKFVLLPADAEGNAPEVYVDGELVDFGVFVTSMEDEETAKEKFGINPDNMITGAKKITFPTIGGAAISLDDNRAVYFDRYEGSSYKIEMINGFYHIKMTWFDENGRVATYNQNELLAPQIYVDANPPIDIAGDKIFYVPIFKEKTINSSDIFIDPSGAYEYYWYIDVDNNPLTPIIDSKIFIPPQHEPREFNVKLVASQDIEDELFETYEKIFKVVIYVPKITLQADPLKEGAVLGTLKHIPEALEDDLSGIPFSLFRKRWGTWKNLGIIMDKSEKTQTIPPLNDHIGKKYIYNDSYYTLDRNGIYEIYGINFEAPSPVAIKNNAGEQIAEVSPENGRIKLLVDGYRLQPLSATPELPTRIAIIKEDTNGIIANIYYVPDSNTDVAIKKSELTMDNVVDIGTTIGDVNAQDNIIAKNIPGYAPSYPGGSAIYNQTPPQKNIALIDTDGTIRIMQAGYSLIIKNGDEDDEPYIFQIINEEGEGVFDIYISADFKNLQIKNDQVMSEQSTIIGLNEIKRLFAQANPQSEPQSDPQSENPFPDLDSSHPFYEEILNLYKARVISGYGDGTFKPDEKLTRAEFIKIALGVTNCYDCTTPTDPQKEKYQPVIPFPDVKLPAWYYYCIWIAKDLAMITGYGDGFFRPNRNISRAEAAAVLLRQSQIEIMVSPDDFFKDVPNYAWYKDYVYTAVMIGLIKNNFGYVNPDEEITRGEFAFMGTGVMNMYDCHEVDEDGDGMPDWWEVENNLDPLFAGDADDDNDNDGRDNLQEWLDGTDPNVPDEKAEEITEEPEEGICPCIDNPNQNDTDGDGIIDPCDEDLDGDGVQNTICMFDDSGLVDEILSAGSQDNCIFIPNEDQLDSDFNGIGDACEPFDECVTVPEDIDGVEDEDGCPEVDDIFEDDGPGTYVTPGDECGFNDYASNLVEGDAIMTAITDVSTHETIHSQSEAVPFEK